MLFQFGAKSRRLGGSLIVHHPVLYRAFPCTFIPQLFHVFPTCIDPPPLYPPLVRLSAPWFIHPSFPGRRCDALVGLDADMLMFLALRANDNMNNVHHLVASWPA